MVKDNLRQIIRKATITGIAGLGLAGIAGCAQTNDEELTGAGALGILMQLSPYANPLQQAAGAALSTGTQMEQQRRVAREGKSEVNVNVQGGNVQAQDSYQEKEDVFYTCGVKRDILLPEWINGTAWYNPNYKGKDNPNSSRNIDGCRKGVIKTKDGCSVWEMGSRIGYGTAWIPITRDNAHQFYVKDKGYLDELTDIGAYEAGEIKNRFFPWEKVGVYSEIYDNIGDEYKVVFKREDGRILKEEYFAVPDNASRILCSFDLREAGLDVKEMNIEMFLNSQLVETRRIFIKPAT